MFSTVDIVGHQALEMSWVSGFGFVFNVETISYSP